MFILKIVWKHYKWWNPKQTTIILLINVCRFHKNVLSTKSMLKPEINSEFKLSAIKAHSQNIVFSVELQIGRRRTRVGIIRFIFCQGNFQNCRECSCRARQVPRWTFSHLHYFISRFRATWKEVSINSAEVITLLTSIKGKWLL